MRFIVNVRPNLRHEFWFPQSKPDPHAPECLMITLNGDGTVKNQVMMQKGNRILHTAKRVGRVVVEPDQDVDVRICIIRAAHIEKDHWDYGDPYPFEITPLTRPGAPGWQCSRMENPKIVEIFETNDDEPTDFQRTFEDLIRREEDQTREPDYIPPKNKDEGRIG